MITEYEPAIAPTVAMFATYAQLGSELAALLRELQYTREHAADRARDAADAQRENARLRVCVSELEALIGGDQRAAAADAQRENARLRVYVSELEALIGGDQRAAALARALVRHDGGGQ